VAVNDALPLKAASGNSTSMLRREATEVWGFEHKYNYWYTTNHLEQPALGHQSCHRRPSSGH